MTRMTLGQALRKALGGKMRDGWLYLPPEKGPLTAQTPCVLLTSREMERRDGHRPAVAVRAGFPREGLHTDDIEGTCDCARRMQKPPSDELLVESFDYYLRFDAFLPHPGAPEPPSNEESERMMDTEFFESLGPERSEEPCRQAGCPKGAVRHSVLCARHHFEMIRQRPWRYGG